MISSQSPSFARGLIRRLVGSHKLHVASRAVARTFLPCRKARFVFVFGCQRSGTTLLKNLIGLDSFVNDAGEYGAQWFKQAPYGTPDFLRARSFPELEESLRAERSRVVLVKPLHDTQRVPEFLSSFPGSPAIFAFREFEGVVRSHLSYYLTGRGERFGTLGHDPETYVRGILNGEPPTWKNENHSIEHREQLERLWPLATSAADRYAIYWISRNRLYFDLALEETVAMVNYDHILANPRKSLNQLSRHIRHRIPRRNAFIVSTPETGRDLKPLDIHPEIRRNCEELNRKLSESAIFWQQRLEGLELKVDEGTELSGIESDYEPNHGEKNRRS